jgi:hypothetical protein
MAVRLGALVPRVLVVAAVWILASGTLTFAADRTLYAHVQAKAPTAAPKPVLVVPDVRSQAFVFAKGVLEDGGFAWHVVGSVRGFATNVVASQSPAPGTRVVDTGAPTITLHLSRGSYADVGSPENDAPYVGTAIRVARDTSAATAKKPAAGKIALSPPKSLHAKVLAHAKAKAKAAPKAKAAHVTNAPAARPPAFHVAGAPKEPLDEISLPARAERLDSWLTPSRRPTAANQKYWLYQHAWIVTGAKFGWWHGAAALRVLISVDRRVESQWGIGSRSEAVARHALAVVEARAR